MQENENKKGKKKKLLLLLLLLLLLVLGLFLYGFVNRPEEVAEEDFSPRILASEIMADAGGEVYVSIFTRNNPGMAGFVLDITYDETVLRPMEIMQGDTIHQGLFMTNFDPKTNTGNLRATWLDAADMEEDGELFAIKFRVLTTEGGVTSPVTIRYDNGNIANLSYREIGFEISNGSVTTRS